MCGLGVSTAHLDQFDGKDEGLNNWQGNTNAKMELRGIMAGVLPGIDIAGQISYPYKDQLPFGKFHKEGQGKNGWRNVELQLGTNVKLNKMVSVKKIIELGADKGGTPFLERLVFKGGLTTKVKGGAKVCCGVHVKRECETCSLRHCHSARVHLRC